MTHRVRIELSLAAAVVGTVLVGAVSAAAPSPVAEFAVPTAGAAPLVITRGPDGAFWFTEFAGNKIGRIDRHGAIVEFPIPTPNSRPDGIVTGPDGNLWFAEVLGNKIGRITPAGDITEFEVPLANARPTVIALGPDGALWFTLRGIPAVPATSGIGRITVDGDMSLFPAVPGSRPLSLTTGPDGNVWYTESVGNAVVRLTPEGLQTRFPLPSPASFPWEITAGPDGALWFTQIVGNRIGRITTTGELTEFPVPTPDSGPNEIEPGPERGTLIFSEQDAGKVGRITVGGEITEFQLDPTGRPLGVTAGDGMDAWVALVAGNAIARLHVVRALGPAFGCPPAHASGSPSSACGGR